MIGGVCMYCAMFGNIVKSRDASPITRDETQRKKRETFVCINEEYASNVAVPFSIIKGDSFEGILHSATECLEIAMRIVRAIHPMCIRIAFGLGSLSTIPDPNNEDVNEADGPAMYCARAALDELTKETKRNEAKRRSKKTGWFNMAIAAEEKSRFATTVLLINGLFALLSAVTDGWTQKQLTVVWTMADFNDKQRSVAAALGNTPSAISTTLKSANYDAYKKAWNALKDYLLLESNALEQ